MSSISSSADPALAFAAQAPPIMKEAAVAAATEVKIFKKAIEANEQAALALIEGAAQAAQLRNATEGVGQLVDVYG